MNTLNWKRLALLIGLASFAAGALSGCAEFFESYEVRPGVNGIKNKQILGRV